MNVRSAPSRHRPSSVSSAGYHPGHGDTTLPAATPGTLAVLLAFTGACDDESSPASASIPPELEGTWRKAGDDGEGHSWYEEITLEGDRYAMEGYPPITETATVKAVRAMGPRRWELFLTDHVFHEQSMEDGAIEALLSPDGRSLELDGESYSRAGP